MRALPCPKSVKKLLIERVGSIFFFFFFFFLNPYIIHIMVIVLLFGMVLNLQKAWMYISCIIYLKPTNQNFREDKK
jgi:hypothetical protein